MNFEQPQAIGLQQAPKNEPMLAAMRHRISGIHTRLDELNSSARGMMSRIFGEEGASQEVSAVSMPSQPQAPALWAAIDGLEKQVVELQAALERLSEIG